MFHKAYHRTITQDPHSFVYNSVNPKAMIVYHVTFWGVDDEGAALGDEESNSNWDSPQGQSIAAFLFSLTW